MSVLQRAWNFLLGLKPVLLMVVVQTTFAWVNVFYRLSQNDGMNLKIMIAYRFIFASAVLVPMALLNERESRKKIDRIVFFQAFLCALFGGALAQNFYIESVALTNGTFASSMANLIPAFTFIMAASLRIEKVGLNTRAGNAKVFGTLISIGGAMLLTFFKGTKFDIWPIHIDLLKHGHHPLPGNTTGSPNLVLGALFGLANCVVFSLWLIIQAKMMARYPYPYSSTALMSLTAAILSIIFALCTEKDTSQWKLGWNIRLATVLYAGIVVSGLSFTLVTWCVRMRGPLFVSVFYPLMLIIAAIAGSLLLDEKLNLGSAIGSVLIICGLYLVLWGKGKEMKLMSRLIPGKEEMVKIVITSPTDKSLDQFSNIPHRDTNTNNFPSEDLHRKTEKTQVAT